jgi:hypothetical protein
MEAVQSHARFEFRRHVDDLTYVFERVEDGDGQIRFKRSDIDLWVVWHERLGWIVWDEESATVLGRPWDGLPSEQSETHPPEGEWVSKKGSKSYVYSLVYC